MADTPEDSQVIRLALDRTYLTQDELREAADRAKKMDTNGHPRTLPEVLVELGFVTRSQLDRLTSNSEDSGNRAAQQIPGYQLQKKIGAGAMAVVYRAKQISLDRVVAVKVLPKRLSRNQEFVERFYKEGKAAAALNHNNIVQAIDVGEAGGFHYFVMEYVEGCTVYDELAESKVYAEGEAIRIIRQVTEALLHAHDKGIIHRDVKPKNIMLTKDRVAKLADMGLARAVTDVEAAMAEAGRAYGTPYYISPEQIRGELHVDHRADIYSLGATMYHMITGRVPFEAPTPSAVMHKHLKEPLTPPDHINHSLTAGCAAMVEMMLSKKKEERYSSCREVLEDLDLIARGQSPRYAQQKLGHDLLEGLKSGQETETDRSAYATPQRESSAGVGTMVLGAVAAVSVLVNIFLLASRQ